MGGDGEAVCGARYGERSPERLNRRNGYRSAAGIRASGSIELAVPKLRAGSCSVSRLAARGSRRAWTRSSRTSAPGRSLGRLRVPDAGRADRQVPRGRPQGSAHGRFVRAIKQGQLLNDEIVAREAGGLSLEDALALVLLLAEREPERLARPVHRRTEAWPYRSRTGRWLDGGNSGTDDADSRVSLLNGLLSRLTASPARRRSGSHPPNR